MSNHQKFESKKGLILGVANDRSLAWAIAKNLSAKGAILGFTYQGEALEKRVKPLATSLGSEVIEPCNVSSDQDLDHLFETIQKKWGHLDFLIHSVAFAQKEDLDGRFTDTSREGFRIAMDVSCYSLVAAARRAAPLMEGRNGSIVTLSYYGSQKVIPNYNVMGVAKAALEASVRYLAHDLGPKKIRVNAISAGPVKTLAAAGIRDFRSMLGAAEEKTPLKENISAEDVGAMAGFLCSQDSRHITGGLFYVDSGANIIG